MNVIVDMVKAVVEGMREVADGPPYFIPGHPLEVARRLLEKDQSKAQQNKKYPLFILKTDVQEQFVAGIYEYGLNILIVDFTERTLTTEERLEQKFKPVLYPLYTGFMDALGDSSDLFFEPTADSEWPEHEKYDRYFYGTALAQKNAKQIFNDPLDAIELINLKLKSYKKIC